MADRRKDTESRGALDILEEAFGLVRTASAATLACYLLGTLPFLLILLYFWADMSRSALAAEHLAEFSLALAGSFLWMKFWQTIYARRLFAQLSGGQANETPGELVRVALTQTVLQPWGLLAIPLAALATIPLPWCYAMFQNVSVLPPESGPNTVRRTMTESWRQAKLGAAQNTRGLLILTVFSFFVFINILSALLLGPLLLKTFVGVETVFTRGGFNPLNTTFLAICAAMTYVCLDPIIKAFYLLRCFYGRSLKTGRDLILELHQSPAADKDRQLGNPRGPDGLFFGCDPGNSVATFIRASDRSREDG